MNNSFCTRTFSWQGHVEPAERLPDMRRRGGNGVRPRDIELQRMGRRADGLRRGFPVLEVARAHQHGIPVRREVLPQVILKLSAFT